MSERVGVSSVGVSSVSEVSGVSDVSDRRTCVLGLQEGGSTSGLDETATKRSFARQTHLRARLLAVRLAR